jgi:hypothetical protein
VPVQLLLFELFLLLSFRFCCGLKSGLYLLDPLCKEAVAVIIGSRQLLPLLRQRLRAGMQELQVGSHGKLFKLLQQLGAPFGMFGFKSGLFAQAVQLVAADAVYGFVTATTLTLQVFQQVGSLYALRRFTAHGSQAGMQSHLHQHGFVIYAVEGALLQLFAADIDDNLGTGIGIVKSPEQFAQTVGAFTVQAFADAQPCLFTDFRVGGVR